MKYRLIGTSEDYQMLCSWWRDWGWEPFPRAYLPRDNWIMVSNNGYDVCAGFLYKTDSTICWFENIISNKHVPKEARQGSVEYLIDVTSNIAKSLGFEIMMSSVSHTGLIKKMVASGYNKEYEKNMSNLVRFL